MKIDFRRLTGPRIGSGIALVGAVTLALGGAGAVASPPPGAPDCEVLPPNNPWNQRVDDLPVADRSDAVVRSVGPGAPLHADFGSGHYDGGPIGIPYTTVGRRADEVPIRFRYAEESDPGPYPIPRDVPIEGGADADGDRHALVIDRYRCRLYELFDAHPESSGKRWRAGSGAVWRLDSNRLRPEGWTSADAAGLPIFPGLARHDEVRDGEIDHALRFTVPESRRAFVYPARHFASDSNDPDLPAMGERFRLRQDFDVSDFPRQPRIVLRALKRYGMIVADNGSPWYVSGVPDERWDNDDLHRLHEVRGADFELVDTSSLPTPGD